MIQSIDVKLHKLIEFHKYNFQREIRFPVVFIKHLQVAFKTVKISKMHSGNHHSSHN